MAKLKYEVIAKTGTYTNKDGEEKARYMKCGVVLLTEKGFSLKLEAIPVGSDGWFFLSEPKEKEARNPSPQAAKAGAAAEFDDPIPF